MSLVAAGAASLVAAEAASLVAACKCAHRERQRQVSKAQREGARAHAVLYALTELIGALDIGSAPPSVEGSEGAAPPEGGAGQRDCSSGTHTRPSATTRARASPVWLRRWSTDVVVGLLVLLVGHTLGWSLWGLRRGKEGLRLGGAAAGAERPGTDRNGHKFMHVNFPKR
jgi:hypothetical protein